MVEMVAARHDGTNTSLIAYPIAREHLNRSCSAVMRQKSGNLQDSVALKANPTDRDLAAYDHVWVRLEDRPVVSQGSTARLGHPVKEPDNRWWARWNVILPDAGKLTEIQNHANAQVDATVAWFKNLQAAAADDGADMKSRISTAIGAGDVAGVRAILDEINAP